MRLCLPASGDVGPGQPCERTSSGFDDCSAGSFCNATLTPDGGYVCRPYCGSSAGCDGDEGCFSVFGAQAIGLCAVPCDLGSVECGPDRSCKSFSGEVGAPDGYLLACGDDGPSLPKGACAENADCPAEHLCFGTEGARCEELCHTDLDCAASAYCDALVDDLGICACRLFGDACPAGSACSLFGSDANGYVTDCAAVGPITTFQPCGVGIGECQAGHVCYGNPENGYTCHPLCDLSHPCPFGTCQVQAGVPDQGGCCVP